LHGLGFLSKLFNCHTYNKHQNAPKRKRFVKEYSPIFVHNSVAAQISANIYSDIRKSLTINDLRKPGPRNPLIVNDLRIIARTKKAAQELDG